MTLHFVHAHANCTRLLDRRVEPGDEASFTSTVTSNLGRAGAWQLQLLLATSRPVVCVCKSVTMATSSPTGQKQGRVTWEKDEERKLI